jgi:hypothetical protein
MLARDFAIALAVGQNGAIRQDSRQLLESVKRLPDPWFPTHAASDVKRAGR